MKTLCALLLLVIPLLTAADQPSAQQPRSQGPDMGRPTKKDDPQPLLDFEKYFVGKWTFEWEVPDSVFGPGGLITGTEIYKPGRDGRYFESEWKAEGAWGPFTGRAVIIYHPDQKIIVRQETDSRGFSLLKSGSVGGDLGGYYTIYYDSAPFTFGGKTLRMKTTTQLLSPANYKVRAQIAEGEGPFLNFGNPWWRKNP